MEAFELFDYQYYLAVRTPCIKSDKGGVLLIRLVENYQVQSNLFVRGKPIGANLPAAARFPIHKRKSFW